MDPGNDTKIENPQSWNKYIYVRNNPLLYTDPTGTSTGAEIQKERKAFEAAHAGDKVKIITSEEVEATAKTVSQGAAVVRNGATVATIGLAATGNPGAVGAGGIATGAEITKVAADGVAVLANRSEENVAEFGIGAIELSTEGVLGVCLEKTVGPLMRELIPEAITAFGVAFGAAGVEANAGPAVGAPVRPLVITTKEAEAGPAINPD